MSGKDVIRAKEKSLERLKVRVAVEMFELESIAAKSALATEYSPRWLAMKLLEDDEEIIRKLKEV